jgi:DNA-binding beta-propeller fold protein YncE
MSSQKHSAMLKSVRRAGGFASAAMLILLWSACGQVYRPVVIPCTAGGVPGCPVEPNPQPNNFHSVFGITTNAPTYPGAAFQIDVSGDSIVASTTTSTANAPNAGGNPTSGAILPNDSKVFVSTAASIYPGGTDAIASFTPVLQTLLSFGFGTVSTIALPSLPNQSSGITALSEVGNTVSVSISAPLLAGPTTTALAPVGTSVVIAGQAIAGYNGTFQITSISATGFTYTDSVAGLAACAPATSNVCAPNGTASIPVQPVSVATSESTSVYVANFNSSSVSKINTTTNVVTNSASLNPSTYVTGNPPANPVAMVEALTSNSFKLYIANQGNNTISSINTVDLSPAVVSPPNVVTGFTGNQPAWLVVRKDSQKVYVVTQGDGQLVTIDTATDTVTSSLSVGVGANYVFYDPNLNRLYVTNPKTAQVYVFSDTGGVDSTGTPNDTPVLLAPSPVTVPGLTASTTPPCAGCGAVLPISVTALLDGTRFYVASYQTSASCPDSNVTAANCVIPIMTVFDANTFAPKYPSTPVMQLLTWPPFQPNQYALAPVTSCAPTALYSPTSTRFRVFTAASEDGSRVYVSMCDAGTVAVINTVGGNANNPGSNIPPDTLITDLVDPYGDGPAQASGEPAFQNPIFLFVGQ